MTWMTMLKKSDDEIDDDDVQIILNMNYLTYAHFIYIFAHTK
jgi:hypothetical protein